MGSIASITEKEINLLLNFEKGAYTYFCNQFYEKANVYAENNYSPVQKKNFEFPNGTIKYINAFDLKVEWNQLSKKDKNLFEHKYPYVSSALRFKTTKQENYICNRF